MKLYFREPSESQYNAAVSRVRKDPRSQYCFLSSGKVRGKGDPHHVIPRSSRPDLIATDRNIVIVNRDPHNVVSSGKMDQIRKLPGIHRLLARMKELDMNYYKRFKQKLYETNTNCLNGLS